MPRSTRTSRGLRALLDDAGDDVALLAGVLPEGELVLGVAQPLQDDLLRGRRGDPAEALGRVVVLARPRSPSSAVSAAQDDDVAAAAVELDPRLAAGRPRCGGRPRAGPPRSPRPAGRRRPPSRARARAGRSCRCPCQPSSPSMSASLSSSSLPRAHRRTGPVELDLDLGRADLGERQPPVVAVDVEVDSLVVGGLDPPEDGWTRRRGRPSRADPPTGASAGAR